MVINIVGAQHGAGELLQEVILFVGGAIGADYANGLAAFAVANFSQAFANIINGFFPGSRRKLAIPADEGAAKPVFVVEKVKGVASLDAEEIAVDPVLIAIIAADDIHSRIGTANPQGGLATVTAVRADGAHVLHLPRTR